MCHHKLPKKFLLYFSTAVFILSLVFCFGPSAKVFFLAKMKHILLLAFATTGKAFVAPSSLPCPQRSCLFSSPVEVIDLIQKAEDRGEIRPAHQNWWPVSANCALDKSRPNPVDLLNRKLVLFWSDTDEEWKCLDDRCSHRFAPLSEGRVVNNDCLQCAYHGWEFSGEGKCEVVPQAKAGAVGRSVQNYPLRMINSMIFVWADPDSYESLGKSIAIPSFPALEKAIETRGDDVCFMRDLPYGYELLGENLLDLSHLPFSHHGVGSLGRQLAGPIKFKMLSTSQKSKDGPMYEAELEDAASSDPIFLSSPGNPPSSNARLNLGFYDPCHVRYTRQPVPENDEKNSYTVLFLCPTSTNKSRVFLFNIFPPMQLPPANGFRQRIKSWVTPSMIKKRLIVAIIKRKFTPVVGHRFSHLIFDGDGIFLHKQGDRMQRDSLSYKDYDTPSSADVMVNAFRRFANASGQKTRSLGLNKTADAIAPTSGYSDSIPRAQMLDRYESHTKHCKVCSTGLDKARIKKRRLEILETALIGSTGASTVTLLGALSLCLLSPGTAVPSALLRVAAVSTASSMLGSVAISKRKPAAQKEIDRFFFEDYIHAEKN